MDQQPDNAKHTSTEALIIRATEEFGLTQKEIAKICNVHQSVVSGWKAGKIDAKWRQVRPLIEKYGDVQGEITSNTYCRITNSRYVLAGEQAEYLRRNMIFRFLNEAIKTVDIEIEEGVREIFEERHSTIKNIIRKIEDLEEVRFENMEDVCGFLLGFNRSNDDDSFFEWIITERVLSGLLESSHKYNKEYVKVYGESIYDYTFYRPDKNDENKLPWMKWSVIPTKNGSFTWIVSKKKHGKSLPEVDVNYEHATWLSEIYENLNAEEILKKAESYKPEPRYEKFVDTDVLLFSLIHAFSENGYDIERVKVIGK